MPHTGALVVLELFPLLRPKGFAVPYDSTALIDILGKCGFSCDVAPLPLVPTGSTAYCVFERRNAADEMLLCKYVQDQVESAWASMLQRMLSSYSLRNTIRDLEQHVGILSHLTTIASISAWREGYWPDSG